MSGSAKAGTIAERHACELRVLPEFAGARSSEARFRRIFYSLTKTYMEVGKPYLGIISGLPVIRERAHRSLTNGGRMTRSAVFPCHMYLFHAPSFRSAW